MNMSECAPKEGYFPSRQILVVISGSHHSAQLLHTPRFHWPKRLILDLHSTLPLGGGMPPSPVSLETLWINIMYVLRHCSSITELSAREEQAGTGLNRSDRRMSYGQIIQGQCICPGA